MVCAHCGSHFEDAVCRVCGTPASLPASIDVASPVLASWWSRVGATLVDTVVLLVPSVLLVYALGYLLSAVATVALQAAYLIYFQTRPEGQTLGNRVVRTRVRDATTGHVITLRQASVRWFVVALYGFLLALPSSAGTSTFGVTVSLVGLADCFYPLFNTRRQTIHDRLAHTIVVNA